MRPLLLYSIRRLLIDSRARVPCGEQRETGTYKSALGLPMMQGYIGPGVLE